MCGPPALSQERLCLVCGISGLFDRLAGHGLDGNAQASLVSLADKLTSNYQGHSTNASAAEDCWRDWYRICVPVQLVRLGATEDPIPVHLRFFRRRLPGRPRTQETTSDIFPSSTGFRLSP